MILSSALTNNMLLLSISFFLLAFYGIYIVQPGCFYKKDGSIRIFGIGYKNKTIFPLWLFSIALGIVCYISMHYYDFHR